MNSDHYKYYEVTTTPEQVSSIIESRDPPPPSDPIHDDHLAYLLALMKARVDACIPLLPTRNNRNRTAIYLREMLQGASIQDLSRKYRIRYQSVYNLIYGRQGKWAQSSAIVRLQKILNKDELYVKYRKWYQEYKPISEEPAADIYRELLNE